MAKFIMQFSSVSDYLLLSTAKYCLQDRVFKLLQPMSFPEIEGPTFTSSAEQEVKL